MAASVGGKVGVSLRNGCCQPQEATGSLLELHRDCFVSNGQAWLPSELIRLLIRQLCPCMVVDKAAMLHL